MIETESHKIRILVAESFDLVRMGLRMLFENRPVISLVGESGSIAALLSLAAHYQPDVILMDLLLVDGNCSELVARMKEASPKSKILSLSSYHCNKPHVPLLPPGISGIVSKYASSQLLIHAICAIHADQIWLNRARSKQSRPYRIRLCSQSYPVKWLRRTVPN